MDKIYNTSNERRIKGLLKTFTESKWQKFKNNFETVKSELSDKIFFIVSTDSKNS